MSLPVIPFAVARTENGSISEEARLLLQVRSGPEGGNRDRSVSGNEATTLARRANWELQQEDLQFATAEVAGWRLGARGGGGAEGGVESVRRRRMSPPRGPVRRERGRTGRPKEAGGGAGVTAAEVWERFRKDGLTATSDSDADAE